MKSSPRTNSGVTGSGPDGQALPESVIRYRSLFQSIREGCCLVQLLQDDSRDPCGFRYLELNPAFEGIAGVSRDQAVGKCLEEVSSSLTPLLIGSLNQVLLTGGPNNCCYVAQPSLRFYEVFAWRFCPDQIAILFNDITEHRQSDRELRQTESSLRLFIELAPVSIAMFDRDMRYLSASRCWSEAHHLSNHDLTGLSHYEILPEIGAEWKKAHRRGMAGEVLRSDCDRFERRDGSVQWMRWEIQPWRTGAGAVGGIVIFAEDITAHRQMQAELEDSKRQLEQRVKERTVELELAVRELQSFSYSVSHDLRAPLRHINSFSSMVIEGFGPDLPGKAREYLDRIRAASNRMGDLIDHLLLLSRVARAKLHMEAVDLSRLAASIFDMYKAAEPDRHVEFVLMQGLRVFGDRTLLRQLLENLLGNAWKFTAHGALARIEFGRVARQGQEVYFVKDNGVGFDMRYQSKLFEAFERLHDADFEGMGIGLATAKKIVERHGGDIWAESTPGTGSVFSFTLGAPAPDNYAQHRGGES